MGQTADFWAALMSGLPDTFLRNCLKMVGVAGVSFRRFLALLVGGDDLSKIGLPEDTADFALASKLGNTVKVEHEEMGRIYFHSRILDKYGCHPDVFKVA
eukprot:3768997-Amphidinium_carterae.1